MLEKAFIATLISLVVVNCGVLFENKSWVIIAEWIRIVVYPAGLIAMTFLLHWPNIYALAAAFYFVISATWFYSLPKRSDVIPA